MKQKSLLVAGLLALLALMLFAMVGCGPVKHTKVRYSQPHTHRQPRTYVQFEHFWLNSRPYVQPRVIIVQPRQPITRRRGRR